MTQELVTKSVNAIRGLAMDGVEAAKSGHAGLPLGAAAMAYALFARHMKFDPRDPKWFDRDRFILSAGHGSMLQYAILHLTGYDMPLEELKRFRQLHSATPGHPENVLTVGVEMATGPLGQGVAHSVGFAIAEKYLAATLGSDVVDHHTYAICSDGDLMEGVSAEAASLAGHLGLGKLIWLYDDNGITIDGATDLAFTEDVQARFRAYGWQVLAVDGMDVDAVDRALQEAKAETGKPTLIACKTIIGYGSPKLAGKNKAHSNPFGPDEVRATKEALGLPLGAFEIDPEALAHWRDIGTNAAKAHTDWRSRVDALPSEKRVALEAMISGDLGSAWLDALPVISDKVATRKASEGVINAIAPHLVGLIGGSADLAESNLTHQKASGDFQRDTPEGKNINFGVREFAMAAAANGITLHGGTRAYCASFLVFSDYARPAIRLAALMECPTIFVFTHDSVGVGEDGPTHEPVEHLTALRCIPNLNVIRPADGYETAAAWKVAVESEGTPTFLALSRQALPALTPTDVKTHPLEKGGYILSGDENPQLILIGTGSELQHAVAAAETLRAEDGLRVRVVSLPSWFLFERQDAAYKASVLPKGVPTVSIEAGSTLAWPRYSDAQVGIDRFGLSAPGDTVMKELEITPENLVATARRLLSGEDAAPGVRSAGGTDHKGPGEVV